MKQLLQSSFVVAAMAVLLIFGVVNTCQINNLERGILANQRAIAALQKNGVSVVHNPRGGQNQAAATRTGSPATAGGGALGRDNILSAAQEREALKDPNNFLQPHERPLINNPDVAYGGTLRFQIGSDPRGMNQYIANGADVSALARYMGNRIATRRVDNLDVYAPELAVKITTPDNGLTYHITLRKGVMWHKPVVDWDSGRYEWLRGDHELTSDDFKFVFDMVDNKQVAGRISQLRNYFETVKKFEVTGRYSFTVHFSKRQFSNRSLILDLDPLPRWLYQYNEDGDRFDDATWGLKLNEHWYNQKMIGTGPFEFVAWEPGVKIEIKRNENYWGERPAFDRVIMFISKDQNAWPRKLKTGEYDYTQLQPEQYRTEVLEAQGPILGKPGIKELQQPTLGYFYIGWNHDTPYFDTKEARQAMTLAFNRRGIIENVFAGLGELTTGPFGQQSPCYDKSIEPWAFDLELAAKKLDAAGWSDTDGDGIRDKVVGGEKIPFEFTMLLYGGSSEYATLANVYKENLLQVGVKLNPRAVEWSTMLKKMDEREFHAYTGAWVLDWETDLMQIWHSKEADKPKSGNRIGFRNKDADRIAVALRSEFDNEKRIGLCHEFHALVHQEQPYTFIYQRNRPFLYWDYLNEPQFSLLYPYRDIRHFSFRESRPD